MEHIVSTQYRYNVHTISCATQKPDPKIRLVRRWFTMSYQKEGITIILYCFAPFQVITNDLARFVILIEYFISFIKASDSLA